ncbi:Rmf/CrpP family protein [Aureimonas populi]|uniref:Rmf/CrpP family protein n=1 Tax=Aureimonas populi TaxID=1701758 RepID=A0ABW5CFY1_9HYPH|nr:Rmf/CrpP family protein [Aureimonas populi]
MARSPTVQTVFKEGKDAHERGLLRSQVPYKRGSARRDEWLLGWDVVLKARQGQTGQLRARADAVPLDAPELADDRSEDAGILGDLPRQN